MRSAFGFVSHITAQMTPIAISGEHFSAIDIFNESALFASTTPLELSHMSATRAPFGHLSCNVAPLPACLCETIRYYRHIPRTSYAF